jgi:cell division septal protein FtsQ
VKVKAPAEKNFRRSRAKPARNRVWRALVSWRAVRAAFMAAVILLAGYRAFSLVYNSSLFRVDRIRVHGNVRISPGEVQALVRELQGAHILTADLAKSRNKLLSSPWLAEAALRRVLPSTVDVYVSERSPFGLCRMGNQLYLVARDGVVIDEFGPKYSAFENLPIIDGLIPRQTAPRVSRVSRQVQPSVQKADPARAALAARVVDDIQSNRELKQRVSQIDVSNPHDAVVILDDDPALLHVGEERFRERLQSYLEIATALHGRIPNIDYVDLRFEQRLFVKARGRSESTSLPLPTAGKTF